jgi:23S rRNA pseudouridine1911/1915/1917 synthase
MAQLSIEPNDRVTYKLWHEDEHVLVVGKPAHVVTMPGLGHERDSLLNALFARVGPRLQKLGRSRDFGLLHRLDRETSGLVVVALSVAAYEGLRDAFERREVAKFYWAIVDGAPKRPEGMIKRPIAEFKGQTRAARTAKGSAAARTIDDRVKKLARVSGTGQEAITAYRTLAQGASVSLLQCRAYTGRLHQVRVHLEAIGCPILGDEFYAPGGVREASPRLALHAHRIVVAHPITKEQLDVRTTWPQDLRATLTRCKLPRPDV